MVEYFISTTITAYFYETINNLNPGNRVITIKAMTFVEIEISKYRVTLSAYVNWRG